MNILIVRSSANKVNRNGYNLQEIGLAKAFVDNNINCDIVYSNGKNKSHKEKIYSNGNYELNILWTELTLKIYNNGYYKDLLDKAMYEKYDYVILSDYIQYMNYRICKMIPEKVILYQGPYADLRKTVQFVYDKLFLNTMKKKIKMCFTKSDLAKKYLLEKGFNNITTVGVGLDTDNIDSTVPELTDELKEIKDKLANKKVLLYIGVLEDRRNIRFLMDIVKEISMKRKDIRLLLIGKGKKEKQEEYFNYMKEIEVDEYVIYKDKVTQDQIKNIYCMSDVFILPTKYEIFGMVMLESMYFKLPIVTSLNGGSSTVIDNEIDGIVIDKFDSKLWADKINLLLDDEKMYREIKENSNKKIVESFNWNKIAKNMLKKLEEF